MKASTILVPLRIGQRAAERSRNSMIQRVYRYPPKAQRAASIDHQSLSSCRRNAFATSHGDFEFGSSAALARKGLLIAAYLTESPA
jgi:hypothetical protein